MRFSLFSILALSASSLVSAIDVNLERPEDSVEGEYLDPTAQEPYKYSIEYKIEGQNNDLDVIELYNGEETVLSYTFLNNEDEDVTVVGVSGSFRDPRNGEIIANITDAKIGPIVIPAGEGKQFQQRIGINLPSDSYLLVPGIYVVKGTALALLGTKTKLVIVDERPISIFSPQLIVLELLLIATIAVGVYGFLFHFDGISYFKTVTKTSNADSKASRISSASATGAKKTVDESWLPEGHVKKTNNKRKTK